MASRGQRERDDGTREPLADPDLVSGAKRAARAAYSEAAVLSLLLTALVWVCPS